MLTQWANHSSTPHYLRDDNVPYSLPVVVRVEKNTNYSEQDAFVAVGKAMGGVLNISSWDESLGLWMEGRIRKMVRKARGAAWESLKALPHVYIKQNNVEVLAFEPHPLAEINPLLNKLQMQGIDFVKAPTADATRRQGILIAVNPALVMSTGKTLAQIGHGVHLAVLNADEQQLERWVNTGFPVHVTSWGSMPKTAVEVTDAGLTEIPAGSLTVKSFVNF